MWRKKRKYTLTNYTTNELLTELLKRGDIPLYPASEEDELKINYFRAFWQWLSPTEIFEALNNQLLRVSNRAFMHQHKTARRPGQNKAQMAMNK